MPIPHTSNAANMLRSSKKSMIRAEFEEVIEDVCTIVALETHNRGVQRIQVKRCLERIREIEKIRDQTGK